MGGILGKSKGKGTVKSARSSKEKASNELFLLLLGSAGVGKSTIFKQVQNKFTKEGFQREELLAGKKCIFLNCVNCMTTLNKLSESTFSKTRGFVEMIADLEEIEVMMRYSDLDTPLVEFAAEDDDLAADETGSPGSGFDAEAEKKLQEQRWQALQQLWDAASVKKAFDDFVDTEEFREAQGLGLLSAPPDCLRYLLDRLDHFVVRGFVPDVEDMLRLRRSTEGSETCAFDNVEWMGKSNIRGKLTSVGGQIHERAEHVWAKVAESEELDLAGIIFVLAPNEFATPVPDTSEPSAGEGNRMGSLEMQLQLLEEVAVAPSFRQVPICVLLNKIDLIEKSLKANDFAQYFAHFKENASSAEDVLKFVKKRAARRVKKKRKQKREEEGCTGDDADSRKYFPSTSVMEVCALDANLVQKAFESIAGSHLQGSLRESGFM